MKTMKRKCRDWLGIGLALLSIVVAVVIVKLTAPDAEAVGTPEPELLVVERPYCEYVPVPAPVRVVIPVVREKEIVIERPIIVQERAERWQGISITNEEKELLACLAWREARGEKTLGMRLVVEVVLNRVLSEHFPNTVYDVLYQPGQFTPDYGVPELDEITPTDAQYEAVELALTETPILEPDVVFFARSPIYGEIFLHVGGHYFTRYPE